jgi:3-deoxy-7-phosphoheptulonate synthase
MKTPAHHSWNPASWQTKPAQRQPTYRDPAALAAVVAQLAQLPPIVVSWEVERLREELAAAQRASDFCCRAVIAPRVSTIASRRKSRSVSKFCCR